MPKDYDGVCVGADLERSPCRTTRLLREHYREVVKGQSGAGKGVDWQVPPYSWLGFVQHVGESAHPVVTVYAHPRCSPVQQWPENDKVSGGDVGAPQFCASRAALYSKVWLLPKLRPQCRKNYFEFSGLIHWHQPLAVPKDDQKMAKSLVGELETTG